MLFGKFFKVFFQYLNSHMHITSVALLAVQLQQQALLQVAGANTRRIKELYFFNNGFYMLFISNNVLPEGKVIANRRQVAAQIAIIINASYNVLGYFITLFIQRQHA